MATYGTYNSPGPFKIAFYGIGLLFAFLIMFYVTRDMYRDNYQASMDPARATARAKTRRDLEAKSASMLNSAGWVNSNKAIVRLPITRAMELTVAAYQSPEIGRSNLIARALKAAEPEPKAPEQPSQFE